MTVKNQEIEEAKEARRDIERKKLAEERKKYTLSQIEKDAKKDFEMERDEKALLEACDSDDGDPDIEFEGINFSLFKKFIDILKLGNFVNFNDSSVIARPVKLKKPNKPRVSTSQDFRVAFFHV